MGGCSSKPQTAESEGLMDHPPTKQELDLLFSSLQQTIGPSNPSPYQGSQHTLKSLFHQHGRDSEDDEQTLHDLLLDAVDSKSLSEAHSDTKDLQPHLSSLPVISNSTQENAEKCIKVEGCLPNLAEETDEKCSKLESSISNSAEENSDKCAKLGVVKNSNLAEENGKLESVISNIAGENADTDTQLEGAISILAEENADKCAEAGGAICNQAEEDAKLGSDIYNLAGENANKCFQSELGAISNSSEDNTDKCVKSRDVTSNLAGENADRCAKLGALISNLTGEDAGKCANLEAESSSRDAILEPKSDLKPISESDSVEIRGFDWEPKSDCLKISEPNPSETIFTEAFNEINASEAMEIEAAEVQRLDEKAMEGKEIKVHAEKAMGGEETEKAMEGDECKETDFHAEEAMEGEITEKAMEVEETEKSMEVEETQMRCENDMLIEENEKAMEGELIEVPQASRAKSQVQDETAIKCDTLQEKAEMQAEKAMGVENTGAQDEKAMESGRPWVQDERVFDGENKNMQEHGKGKVEDDENAMRVATLGTVQDGEKAELRNEKQAGVQDKETGVQDEGIFYGEKAKAVHVYKAGTVDNVENAELRNEKQMEMQDEETGVQREKAGVHINKAGMEGDIVFDWDKAKVVCVEKTGTPQEGENLELKHEKKAGVEDKKTEVQHGVQCEETGVQSEREGAQDDRVFDGGKAKLVCVKGAWTVQQGEKSELQQAKRTGVQDEETGVQDEETGVQEEGIVKTKVQDEEHAEDEKAMEGVSPLHVKHLFAFTSEPTHSEHSVTDACTNPLGRCTELPMLPTPCEPALDLVSKENTIEAADLVIEQVEKIELIGSSSEAVVARHDKLDDTVKAFNSQQSSLFDSDQMLHIEKKHGKLEYEQIPEIPSDFEHSKAGLFDGRRDAQTHGLGQSSVKAGIGFIEDSYKVVSEYGTSDDRDMKVETDVLSEEHGFVQIAHEYSQSSEKTEPQNGVHNQPPINELDLITSKCTEAEQSLQPQVYNASSLRPPLAESSVHENLSCPTVVDLGVEKGLVEMKSSDLLPPKVSVNEGVESKPRQKSLGEDVVKATEEEINMIHEDEVMAQMEEAPK